MRAGRTLRWHGKDHVAMAPYQSVPAHSGGEVSLTCRGETWSGTASDHMTVRPVPDGDAGLPPLGVTVAGRGETAEEDAPRVTFIGGGPVQTPTITRFHDVWKEDMARVQSLAGQTWWAGSGLQVLQIRIGYQAPGTRVRGRVTGQRLGVVVDVSDKTLDERDHAELSRELAEEVVALARRRTGLGPHPGLPSG